jgi:xylose isomerase
MVGTVNFMQTLEVLFQLIRKGFDGVIYFDTFPDVSGLDPVRECENNIAMVNSLWELAKDLKVQPELTAAIDRQDAVLSQDIVRRTIFAQREAPAAASV